MKKHFFLTLLLTIYSSANEIKTLPSFQGFQGVVNTPNAEVLSEGEFGFLYNNQVENFDSKTDKNFRDNRSQKNHFLNMGIFSNFDLNLRYAVGEHSKTKIRHLSDRIISFKYQLPFLSKDIANFAIGMQDIGGGSRHMTSSYFVTSKEFQNFRTTVGFAKGDEIASLNGFFGSVEYQPLSWLQLSSEYDTKEWNMALKSFYPTHIGKQKIILGAMAKSSLDYNEPYFGIFAQMPLNEKAQKKIKEIRQLPVSKIEELKKLGLSNLTHNIEDNTIYLSYENTLYSSNDIDALGMVLGIVATSNIAPQILISIKKSDIIYQSIATNTKEYQSFLKTGNYRSGLLRFFTDSPINNSLSQKSDQFRPLVSLQPALSLVDGSEYGEMDYSLSLQAEASMRLAKGTIISTRLNIPLTETDNFKKNGVFNYRARNRGDKLEIDQILLSQYLQPETSFPWINLLQVGQFEKGLEGLSYETAISDKSGKHQLMLKIANLDDNIYKEIDWYNDTNKREERLISYRYYWDTINSNIKLTAGQFLYGDKGVNFTFKRYFSDLTLNLDLGKTEHPRQGTNSVGKFSLSIPLGTDKRIKTAFTDIKFGDLSYQKNKNLVSNGEISYAKPFHTEEVSNSFSLENYYLDKGRFQPSYIKENVNRLRNVFLGE
jgi:hypothetical protein